MSVAQSQILQAKRRARDYWNIDGLPTLMIGVFFLLSLEIFQIPERLGERPWFLLFVIAVNEFQNHEIVLWLKERLTYPRTGYVAPPEREPASPFIQLSLNKELGYEETGQRIPWPSLQTALIAGLLLAPLLIWIFVSMGRWIEAAFFILLGTARLKAIGKNKLAWIDASGFVLAGLAIAFLPFTAGILLFLAPGILFTLRGAITLLRYLHRNPLPKTDRGDYV